MKILIDADACPATPIAEYIAKPRKRPPENAQRFGESFEKLLLLRPIE